MSKRSRVANVFGERRKEVAEKFFDIPLPVLSHQVAEPPTVACSELAMPTLLVFLFGPPADKNRTDGRFLPGT